MSSDGTFDSTDYWRRRYADGGNSGAGSYGRLAVFKGHVVNTLVHERRIRTVIEFGSGDGHQMELIWVPQYLGVDVSAHAVERCRERHEARPQYRFRTLDDYRVAPETADLAMSLDVIFHLVEDTVFHDYMEQLFDAAERYVLVYSSDIELDPPGEHVRHRDYRRWIDEHRPDWTELQHWPQPFARAEGSNPRHTSLAEFRLFGRRSRG